MEPWLTEYPNHQARSRVRDYTAEFHRNQQRHQVRLHVSLFRSWPHCGALNEEVQAPPCAGGGSRSETVIRRYRKLSTCWNGPVSCWRRGLADRSDL